MNGFRLCSLAVFFILLSFAVLTAPASACDKKKDKKDTKPAAACQKSCCAKSTSCCAKRNCPPAPRCCRDAVVCVRIVKPQVCYTPEGVHAFLAVFKAAAEKGVENATVRAFNSSRVAPPCKPGEDCDKKKKK